MATKMKKYNLSATFLFLLIALVLCQFSISLEAQIEVSFPDVDEEPLSHIPEDAIVLYDGWLMEESAIIGMDGEILRDVTQYSAEGWDWVPAARDRNMGIWQNVLINATGDIVIADPAVFTEVDMSEEITADLKLRFFVSNVSKINKNVDLIINIQNENRTDTIVKFHTSINVKAGSKEEIIFGNNQFPELRIKNPDLWWPVNYGDQPLYHLDMVVITEGQVSSRVCGRFGVCEVSSYILPSGGRAFAVNGRPVRITGGAWISDFLLSWSAQRYRDEIKLMAEGNATVVRVNGCSIMPSDVFLMPAINMF